MGSMPPNGTPDTTDKNQLLQLRQLKNEREALLGKKRQENQTLQNTIQKLSQHLAEEEQLLAQVRGECQEARRNTTKADAQLEALLVQQDKAKPTLEEALSGLRAQLHNEQESRARLLRDE